MSASAPQSKATEGFFEALPQVRRLPNVRRRCTNSAAETWTTQAMLQLFVVQSGDAGLMELCPAELDALKLSLVMSFARCQLQARARVSVAIPPTKHYPVTRLPPLP